MQSVVVGKEVLDFHFKRFNDYSYIFNIGSIYVGQVFNIGGKWSCVSKNPNKIFPVHGFKTRYDAAIFLLRFEGFH